MKHISDIISKVEKADGCMVADLADLRKLAVEKANRATHFISPSLGNSGMGDISQNAGSIGYPTRQELGRAFAGESVPPTRKKSRY